uniref:Uncharacterized protein n=1 Tax=Anguilla anguilla TaxID=7936 RepID=A0A0E9VP10_ANGAN
MSLNFSVRIQDTDNRNPSILASRGLFDCF